MTRKCVLCKETNYKNTYSFFSAPKDPETRKKWQIAIAIENYAVTDDTYVCSKHFHKDDIITHWVSGVPPHVITIKYKKCRLRPGAVPGRDYHLEENKQTNQEHSDDSDINMSDFLTFKSEEMEAAEKEKESFVIPRMKENNHKDNGQSHKNTIMDYQFSSEFEDDFTYIQKSKNSCSETQSSKDASNGSFVSADEHKSKNGSEKNLEHSENITYMKEESICNTDIMESMNSEDANEEQQRIREEKTYSNVPKKASDISSKLYNVSEGDDSSVEMWECRSPRKDTYSKDKSIDNTHKSEGDFYIKNEVLNNLSYDQLDVHLYSDHNESGESEMLFEDLLEICTEVALPRGWSCVVASKGHATTVVYLYMGMTKNGMPFAEKQVFVKSDMTLRCAAVNREINPLMHNLIREGKHLKVQTLLDVEELIDEFDQRVVCQGMYNTEGFQEANGIKIAYKDGVKWRHVLCPLIVNNDSLRCTRCITLSHMLSRKSKNFFPFRYNPLIFVKKQQKLHSLRQIQKRTRKHDRRYEFIKTFKK